MSSFEWNKIIASVLTAMIVAMVSGILASQLVRPKDWTKPVFLPPGAEGAASAAAAAAGRRRAGADRAAARQGRPARKASRSPKSAPLPHLQQGRSQQDRAEPVGHHARRRWPRCRAINSRRRWRPTREKNGMPESSTNGCGSPQSFIKGTKMTFAGIPKAQKRADSSLIWNTLK